MRRTIPTIYLIAALSGLTVATQAQVVVWSLNFDSDALGTYGTTTDYGGGSGLPETTSIVTPGDGGSGNAMQVTFYPVSGLSVNFQSATPTYAASGNTDPYATNYTLSFDMAIQGVDISSGYGGLEISVQNGGGIFGPHRLFDFLVPPAGSAGSGYQHYSYNLGTFSGSLALTNGNLAFGIGVVAYGNNMTASPETILLDNVQITMKTNPPPPPPPTLSVLITKPGLRIFAKNYSAPFNQEGLATVDWYQSWVGATPSNPKSYSITFEDFDTIDNYTLYVQFVPGAGINPYVVWESPNAFVWSITHVGTGFTTSVDWKTNHIEFGQTNNALTLATTSTDGRGTWTLTFTNDTDGTVTAPGGSSGSFSLPADMAALFADPVGIYLGTAPNGSGGYGQYIDISRITTTNVTGVRLNDDFTKESDLDPAVWDTSFSLDSGSVIQVSTNSALWVNWTVPDDGYGLGTKASLKGGTNVWFSPSYYGNGVTPIGPEQMGPSLKWVLLPKACLPTVDGTVGGTPSTQGFFRMSNPAPIQ